MALAPANLPDDMLENVFTHLPIKDAVDMSILSTRFKKTWCFNRKFHFGRDFSVRFVRGELVEVIDHVFHSHKGNEIQSFHLNIDPIGIGPTIDNWLQICIAKGIEYLELYFSQPGYILRVEFMDNFEKLRTLKLTNCHIQLPLRSIPLRGMRFLNTLALCKVRLTEQKLETLVAQCEFLAILELYDCPYIQKINVVARNQKYLKIVKIAWCHDVEQVNVDVPNLGSFFYIGFIVRFRFGESIALNDVFFDLFSSTLISTKQLEEIEFLINVCLRGVKVLSISAEGLAARMSNGVYREAQFCLPNLKELQLFMEGTFLCNPYDILMFVKNCPVLESLFIDLNGGSFESIRLWEELHHKSMLENFNYSLNELRIVKLKGFKFRKLEVELVKILLKKAMKLEFLIFISPRNGYTELRQRDIPKYSQLFQSCKASPFVKINLYDHANDNAFHPFHQKYWYRLSQQ